MNRPYVHFAQRGPVEVRYYPPVSVSCLNSPFARPYQQPKFEVLDNQDRVLVVVHEPADAMREARRWCSILSSSQRKGG